MYRIYDEPVAAQSYCSTITNNIHHNWFISLFQLLTPSAVEDFNRARKYLKNMAANHGVPVYSSLTDAMQTAALKVKSRASMVHSVIAEH